MGLSIGNTPGINTLLADMALAEAQGEEMEGLLPQEGNDAEMLEELREQLGTLQGEGKNFALSKEQSSPLPQKLQLYLTETSYPHHKMSDPKNKTSPTPQESLKETKEFKLLELPKPALNEKIADNRPNFSKVNAEAHKVLEKSHLLHVLSKSRETPDLQKQRAQEKTLEHKVNKELTKSHPREHHESNRKVPERERETPHGFVETFTRKQEKNEEREQQRQQREEEEGFAEGQRDRQQEQPNEEEKKGYGTVKIDETYMRDFAQYAAEESILSQIFNMRVSQFDVLVLFLEILKLDIKGREQVRIARQEERALQIMHMQQVVENYKEQGKWQMFSGIGAGILGLVSGISPIIGYMKGDWIIEKLGTVFDSLRDMKKKDFFEAVQKITETMSNMQKNMGEIHKVFSEGNRTYDEHMSNLYRTDYEESTRTLEEIKENWKSIENFLYQTLQMYHDAIRQLYS